MPAGALFELLSRINRFHHQDKYDKFDNYINNQIDRLEGKDYRANLNLLKEVVTFNQHRQRLQSTTKIMRSIGIEFKNEPEFLERCNKIANSF